MPETGDGRARERRTWMSSADLLERIHAKRAEVDSYLSHESRRRRLLIKVVVVASALAAVLTAGPAAGGKGFTNWLSALFHSDPTTNPSWQLLCIFATLCSAATLIATQLQKSNSYDENIARARVVRATLETLELSVTAGSVTSREATQEFLRCIEDCSFIDPVRTTRTPAVPPAA